jgi:hypothetical protein
LHKRSLSHIDAKRDKSDEILMYSSGGEGNSKDSDDTLELKEGRPIKARRPPSAIEEISSEESP